MPAAVHTRPGRSAWVAAVAVAVVTVVAGCTSSGPAPVPTTPASAQRSDARYPTAASLLTQCAITHGVTAVRSSAAQYNRGHPKRQAWLTGDRVELTGANGSNFTDWFDNGGGAAVAVGGRQLAAWPRWAADHDQLPAQVCGHAVSGPAVRQLYAQVYAHWAAQLDRDPW